MVSAIDPPTVPADATVRRLGWLLLCAVWLAVAAAVAVYSRTSLPSLALAAVALVPATVSAVRAVRPTGSERAWLGIVALALALAVLVLALAASGGGEPRPVAPSAGIAFATLAAATASLLLGVPLPVARRDLTVAGLAIGAAAALATAALALGTNAGAPAGCVAPRLAGQALVTIRAEALIDDAVIGRAELSGQRAGSAEQWHGGRSGDALTEFRLRYTHTATGSWLGPADLPPESVDPPLAADGTPATLDGRLAAWLAGAPLHLADDLGLAHVDGAAARHCRLVIDGTTGTRLLLPQAWLVADDPLAGSADLPIWRGELDWWLVEGGALRRADLHVGGLPRDAWESDGLRGELRATVTVGEPSSPIVFTEPLP